MEPTWPGEDATPRAPEPPWAPEVVAPPTATAAPEPPSPFEEEPVGAPAPAGLGFGEVDLAPSIAAGSPSALPARTKGPVVLGDEEPFPFDEPDVFDPQALQRPAAAVAVVSDHPLESVDPLAFGERSLDAEPFLLHPPGAEPPVDEALRVTMAAALVSAGAKEEPAPLPAPRGPPALPRGPRAAPPPPPPDEAPLEDLFDSAGATRVAEAAATRDMRPAGATATAVVPPPALERTEAVIEPGAVDRSPWWRRRVTVAAAAVVVVIAGVGIGATWTPYGPFFIRAVRGELGANRPGARFVNEARQRLAEDRYTSVKSAVELSDRALRLDARDVEAQATYTYAVALLARRHGGAAAAWTRARAFVPELGKRAASDPEAAKAVVSAALVTGDRSADAAVATLERHVANPGAADGDALLVLGDAALQRGDAALAATYYRRLDALQPGSARASHGLGVAAARRGDAPGALRLLEAALGRDPQHLSTTVELAALALSTGDRDRAEALARAVLADGQAQAGPRQRARARTVMALLLLRAMDDHVDATLAAVERELEAAVQEDPDAVEPRVAFAQFLLDRGTVDRALSTITAVPAGLRDGRVVPVQARIVQAQDKPADAMALLDAAIAKFPADGRLLHAKGVLSNEAGKQADADRLWNEAIQRDPAAFEPHLALSQARSQRSDLEGAERELKLASERAPANPAVLCTAADLLLARHDLAGAESGYDATLAVDRSHAPAYLGLARIALEYRDAASARSYLQRAVAIAPRLAPAQALHGELLWKAGDLPGARKAFERAVALDARDSTSLARLGAIELLQGDRDAAVTHLRAAANLTVPSAEVRAWYGRALLAKGEPQAAVEQLKKSIELDARDAVVHLQLGQAYERLANPADAVQSYRAAQQLSPQMVEAYEALGMLYSGQNRCQEASPQLERAAALARDDVRLRIALADCKAKLGRNAEAVALYRRVLQSDPKQVALYYKIARTQHEAIGIGAAMPWYEQAAREEPGNPMPHYYMGFAHKERGRSAKAIAEFREYLRISPNALDRKDIEREIDDLGGGSEAERP